ncbi:MAG: penicillin-binding protein 2 [Candidatus Paceibacteria bacterium]|jgi:penicillin-binding protein 2
MSRLQDRYTKNVEVEEVLLDASNIPAFNRGRLEGKRELPITKRNIYTVWILFLVIAAAFIAQIFSLQVVEGDGYRLIAENNRVDKALIIAERGVVYDRRGEMMIWNEVDESGEYDFPIRAYTDRSGLGQVLGYVSYPKKDNRGYYFRTEYLGRSGVELAFDTLLKGENGSKIIEVDALADIISEFAINAPSEGGPIALSVDAELSEAMYDIISTSSAKAGFRSGAGAIMNIHTGEILALTSFPSFDPEVMADGDDVNLIREYNLDDRLPFLNKVIGGAYAPGSIVKPFVAYSALENNIISPDKEIISYGSITIPNPYDPSNPSRFNDWRSQGKMTMREAIAFSSNVYFYIIGGGLPEIAIPQAGLNTPLTGLGITKMAKNFRRFGMGQETGINIAQEQVGVVPDPEWKQKVFDDDWRLGDTYLTAIGQFGFLTTPIQMLRAYAALANGGFLITPHVEAGQTGEKIDIGIDADMMKVVHEGMRKTVNMDGGTARSLERSDVAIAGKSGTAEVGAGNAYVNSWVAGFWPYEEPEYAFILMMDHAPRSNALGATTIMGDVVEWMSVNRQEYLELKVN